MIANAAANPGIVDVGCEGIFFVGVFAGIDSAAAEPFSPDTSTESRSFIVPLSSLVGVTDSVGVSVEVAVGVVMAMCPDEPDERWLDPL